MKEDMFRKIKEMRDGNLDRTTHAHVYLGMADVFEVEICALNTATRGIGILSRLNPSQHKTIYLMTNDAYFNLYLRSMPPDDSMWWTTYYKMWTVPDHPHVKGKIPTREIGCPFPNRFRIDSQPLVEQKGYDLALYLHYLLLKNPII